MFSFYYQNYLYTNELGDNFYFDRDQINFADRTSTELFREYNIADSEGNSCYCADLVTRTLSEAFSYESMTDD